ncbi:MAG TPA: acetate--CoA ligase family protein, partial [Sedimentisphaerales bacterium]|nr:acetate--CoA ligase family protein [Sedimentisphaerales bacterium]
MSFENFFNPKTVAVVGASRQPGKVGYEILKSMIDGKYEGKIFPINPKADDVEGIKCYPDLSSIGEVPDLVIVVIPAKFTIACMEECAKLGVNSVIIITAGFKETGKAGKDLEDQVAAIAKKAGIRIIGPNCLGVLASTNKLNASFGGKLPIPGAIGYISQSGALLSSILDMANTNDIGFSKLVSFGNKCDLDELDTIEAFGGDDETKVIAGYLESITKGAEFVKKAEAISRKKPILLMKSGTSSAGARAASSHTGSLAGSDTAYRCAFERTGIIRCDSIKTQFDFAQAFAHQPLPAGDRVAVVTNAGGAGIMATDAIEGMGLTFATLTEDTKKKLGENLPAAANIKNPIDVLGDALADRYEFALDVALDDPNVDAILLLLTPQVMTQSKETAEAAVRVIKKKPTKPVLACFIGAEKVMPGWQVLQEGGIPQYDCPEAAVKTLKAMVDYAMWRKKPQRKLDVFKADKTKVQSIIDAHLKKGMREVGELDAKEVLKAYGFVTPAGAIAETADDAAKLAGKIGYPIVMKIWSPDISHKSDVGGVKVGLKNADEVKAAFNTMMTEIPKKMPNAKLVGVYVQEMSPAGREIILGIKRDPQFGAMVMFGLGGIFVEVLKDVEFALAPLTKDEALAMMKKTKSYKLLEGVRGQKGVDIDLMAENLQRLAQLVTDFPQIVELDINPM